jgi:DHA2 family multidrug resistance protein
MAESVALGTGAQPDEATLPVKHRMVLVWAVMGISICQFLDATIANVALPHMQTSLGASADTVSWVLTSFIMAGAIITPVTGWLSDRFGSRRLFLFATTTFLVSSAFCGAATSLTAMVLFRTVQGAAAAIMGPMSQTIMFDINPPSKQAGAMTLWGTVSMLAPISGPFLGGFLTETLNWRWVYYVNLPMGIPALMVLWVLLPSRKIVGRKLDIFGFSMIGLGLGALQLMLDRGQQQDWLNSWEIIIELVIAVSCLWMFLVRTMTTAHPLFSPKLYKNPNFVAGMGFMAAMGVANVSLSATLPTMYQNIYGYSVIDTGMLMAPRGIGLTLTMLPMTYLVKRVDFRVLICAGFTILSYALWTMSQWSLNMGYEQIIYSSLIQGVGLGFVFTPINLVAFGTLDPELRTDGSSLLALFRNMGSSFGISFIVTFMARNSQISHADIAAHVTNGIIPGIDLSSTVGRAQDIGGAAMAMINGEVSRQAAMIAYLDNFHVMAWALLALAPLPFLLRRPSTSEILRPAQADTH